MSIVRLDQFDYPFCAAGEKDIGRLRENNQDEVIVCPQIGFFAVTDGMGGLSDGAAASAFVEKAMSELMKIGAQEFSEHQDVERAAAMFQQTVQMMSDHLYTSGNTDQNYSYGATFTGVWLLGNKAVFVNLGDSRGYLLPRYRKQIEQVTVDQNLAGILVQQGEITREEARTHPASSRLTAFVGMKPPAEPEVFSVEVHPGDRILLCSDGLYGLMEEPDMVRILRSSRSSRVVCERLIAKSNDNGGKDNISVVYIRMKGKGR